MIGDWQVQEILKQYNKHGWNLRRVLLSVQTRENLPAALFGQAEIVSSRLDAAWFSRRSLEGRETWELRHLSTVPFALVEVFEDDDDEEVREETRSEMETQMLKQASKSGS